MSNNNRQAVYAGLVTLAKQAFVRVALALIVILAVGSVALWLIGH